VRLNVDQVRRDYRLRGAGSPARTTVGEMDGENATCLVGSHRKGVG
jgi:hypothetical protein